MARFVHSVAGMGAVLWASRCWVGQYWIVDEGPRVMRVMLLVCVCSRFMRMEASSSSVSLMRCRLWRIFSGVYVFCFSKALKSFCRWAMMSSVLMDEDVMKKGVVVGVVFTLRFLAFQEAVMMFWVSMARRSKGFVAA